VFVTCAANVEGLLCCQATRVAETTRGRARNVCWSDVRRIRRTPDSMLGERAFRSCSGSTNSKRAPHAPECEAEGVSCDTCETTAGYAARNRASTCARRAIRRRGQRPSRKSQFRGLRAGAVKARRPRGTRGRSEAQRLVRRRAQRQAVTRDGPQFGAARAHPETCRCGVTKAM